MARHPDSRSTNAAQSTCSAPKAQSPVTTGLKRAGSRREDSLVPEAFVMDIHPDSLAAMALLEFCGATAQSRGETARAGWGLCDACPEFASSSEDDDEDSGCKTGDDEHQHQQAPHHHFQ
eukprot:GHVT01010864.1.p3 GENE.GHVT01010864.1~~GHVT01010864.1.p3  ORF type:complete len:120 (+),score=16.39 GHVT01010864.1:3071-3430(+)